MDILNKLLWYVLNLSLISTVASFCYSNSTAANSKLLVR